MQLKKEGQTQPRKLFHMTKKLSRARQAAKDFEQGGKQIELDARSKVDIQVSLTLMSNQGLLPMDSWGLSLGKARLATCFRLFCSKQKAL
jgi:hypothetical protein